MAEPASARGKPSDEVCEAADAPAPSFKPDTCKHFGYSLSQEAFQVPGVFAHTEMKVYSVSDKCRIHFFHLLLLSLLFQNDTKYQHRGVFFVL